MSEDEQHPNPEQPEQPQVETVIDETPQDEEIVEDESFLMPSEPNSSQDENNENNVNTESNTLNNYTDDDTASLAKASETSRVNYVIFTPT